MKEVIFFAGSVITIHWMFQQFLTANSTNNAASRMLVVKFKGPDSIDSNFSALILIDSHSDYFFIIL